MPGASEPRLTELNPSGLQIGFSNRLRGLSNRSIVVVGNYTFGPITADTMPSERTTFTPSSILFRPHHQRPASKAGPLMVEAPGTAPGSERFIATAIYRHIRLAPAPINIGAKG